MGDDWLLECLAAIAERRDGAAFARLFDHLAPRFKSFALGKGFAERQAEEIAQEAMLLVWTRATTFKPDVAGPMTWLFAIVRNKCTDVFRREGRTHVDLDEVGERADDEGKTPEALLSAARARERLSEALDVLSAEQRAVVQLAYFEERTQAEIAELLDIPMGTVKSRLRLAYERLRYELPEIGP